MDTTILMLVGLIEALEKEKALEAIDKIQQAMWDLESRIINSSPPPNKKPPLLLD